MKKLILLLALLPQNIFAESPQFIEYQKRCAHLDKPLPVTNCHPDFKLSYLCSYIYDTPVPLETMKGIVKETGKYETTGTFQWALYCTHKLDSRINYITK